MVTNLELKAMRVVVAAVVLFASVALIQPTAGAPIVKTIKPESWSAYNEGVILASKGQIDKAIAAYNKAISIDAQNAAAYYNLAQLMEWNKMEFSKAEALLSKAISIRPNEFEFNAEYGNVLAHEGKIREALAAYQKASVLPASQAEKAKLSRNIARLKDRSK